MQKSCLKHYFFFIFLTEETLFKFFKSFLLLDIIEKEKYWFHKIKKVFQVCKKFQKK